MKVLMVLVALALTLLVEGQLSMNNPNYCYSSDPVRPQNGMHSTQASYEAIRRPSVDTSVSSCTPSRFWFVSRHGGRFPNAPSLLGMIELTDGPLQNNVIENYEAGETSLCAADFNLLREWIANPLARLENADLLTPSGREIMESLAQRYQQRYPTLLLDTFNRTQFRFRHTDRQRSEGSIRAFAEGLFGSANLDDVEFDEVPERDTFLRPNDFCPTFNLYASTSEANAFSLGPEFRETMSQVNQKLGFTGANQLNGRTISTIWDICRFEKTMDLRAPSPWCTSFSVRNNQVLEYHADLEYYYRNGYGVANRRLVQNLNCGLMQDMLRFLNSSDSAEEPVRIYGTHSSALQLFLVSLGVFQDEDELTRHNVDQQMTRQWKTSWISPKGANLAIVRYDCADGDNDVLFLFNERPLQVPGCQSNGLCKVNFILQQYSRFIDANCAELFCSSN